MALEVPGDLLSFLQAGHQLSYDVDRSQIDHITRKSAEELQLSTITTSPGCQRIIDDPYEDLAGVYQVEVYDLVATSDLYDPEGLLCWIIALRQFGCVDAEHGDVIVFPGLTWAELVKNPMPYLDAQWSDSSIGERVLPWLHFPFKPDDADEDLVPYGSTCPVHHLPVTVQRGQKPPLFEVHRRRQRGNWLASCRKSFPCAGLPVKENKLLCCSECRRAEELWVQKVFEEIPPLEVTPNALGWIKCPGCGSRFLESDSNMFARGIHKKCGQKVRVVPREPSPS